MNTRKRILNEASRQLCAHGYADFTIAAVRDALGLSSGSMFHAFASKPALAAAVFVDGMRNYQNTASAAITANPDPVAALKEWIRVHLKWVESHRELAHFLFSTQPDDVMAHAADPLHDANATFYATIAMLLTATTDAGLSGQLQHDVGHAIVIGPAQEYCRRWTRGATDTLPTALTALYQDAALAALHSTLAKE